MSFLVSEELSFRIPVELRYAAADPYAVRLTFHLPGDAPVTWAFGRELLVDGVAGPCGDGDVRIEPVELAGSPGDMPGEVHIRLQVGGDQALFKAGVAPSSRSSIALTSSSRSARSGRSPTSRRISTRHSTGSSPRSRARADGLQESAHDQLT